MKNNHISDFKEKSEIYDTALETWKKQKLSDINSISFDAACTDLIIPNSISNAAHVPTAITIFNNKESISI